MEQNYFHVVTPFSRPGNFGRLCEMLVAAGLREGRGDWTPIFAGEHERETTYLGQYHTEPVITALVTREGPMEWDPCYWKLNEWLRVCPPLDNRWVGFLADDDGYDGGFFEGLSKRIEEEEEDEEEEEKVGVMVVSARRYEIFDKEGSHWVLPACRENLRRCRIGLEQFFIRGSVLKKYSVPEGPFENEATADGGLIERMVADGVRFGFAPELYVNWNALRGDG